MARFDVHRLADGLLVVDLQSDPIRLDASRMVAPLRAVWGFRLDVLDRDRGSAFSWRRRKTSPP